MKQLKINNMKKLLLIGLILSACGTTKYITNSNFYKLQKGMTEQAFLEWIKPNQIAVNGRPVSSKMFNYGGSEWKVYVFQLYNVNGSYAGYSHNEFVAFKDGRLIEYGEGNLPLTLRQNPNSYQITVK
jgi:hypothetical protein